MADNEYHISPVGMVPKEWEIRLLGKIADVAYGIGDPLDRTVKKGIPIIAMPNVTKDGRLILDNVPYVHETNVKQKDLLQRGDMLFNWRNGSKDHLGKTALFNVDGKYTHVGFLLRIRCRAEISPEYIYAYIKFIKDRGFFLRAKAQVNNTFNKEELNCLPMVVPPLSEQRKIAAILSTWDRAIEQTQKLIYTKTRLKRGLTQQLLTGKRRFAEFKGQAWRKATLSECAEVIMGVSPPSSAYNNMQQGLPLIQGNADIANGRSKPKFWTNIITKKCFPGDILLSVRAPIGEVAISDHNACIGRGMCAIKGKTSALHRLLYQILMANESAWFEFGQGSTFTAINSFDIRKWQFDIPSNSDEQELLASVLTKCDNEINHLNSIVGPISTQKKALMQVLLTGKVRVKAGKECKR